MVVRAEAHNTSVKIPSLKVSVGICVFAGIVTGILVALLTPASTPAVHADADALTPAIASVPTPLTATPDRPTLTIAVQQASAKTPPKKRLGVLHGLASWYGGVFDGRKTASGEKFDKNALTACQPDLPFGSLVRVINRRNKRSVVVRINDRGDLVDARRIIDLSWAAAEKLNMTRLGLAKVDVEVLSLGAGRGGNPSLWAEAR